MNKYLEILILKNMTGIGTSKINEWGLDYIRKFDNYSDFIAAVQNKTRCSDAAIYRAEEIAKEIKDKHEAIKGLVVITPFDERYPKQLSVLGKDSPVLLYARGCTEILNSESASIIGSRQLSNENIQVAKKITERIISKHKRVIVSGLALGCDEIAHKAALDMKGKTIAVLPSGLDRITPHQNKELANKIADGNGCLITEYDLGCQAKRYTYVDRDRITAALSKETIVIECAKGSGTMKTVEVAKRINRKVGCCHFNQDENTYLISSGLGTIIDSDDALDKFMIKSEGMQSIQLSLFD